MTFLSEKIKPQMRISSAQTAFDVELTDLIAAARQDLKLSGVLAVKADSETDPLIVRAVSTYVKANFGWENKDADKFQASYEALKSHLTLSQEYTLLSVTFTVTDGTGALPDAEITFNSQLKVTNSVGSATFIGIKPESQNMKYTVTLDGFIDVYGEVDADVSTTVAVTMTAVG